MLKKSIPVMFIVAGICLLILAAIGLTSPGSAEQVNNTAEIPPVEYVWTGAAGDGLWSTEGNWEPNGPPPLDSGLIRILNSKYLMFTSPNYKNITVPMIPVTIPAGYTAECTFGNGPDHNIYGPAFGMHLDIKGSLKYKGYLCAGQPESAGQRSVLNMYSGSSISGGEGIAIGDNWWAPGPYLTMNMYGDSRVDANWLWFGAHLNMYGGQMTIRDGVYLGIRHPLTNSGEKSVQVDPLATDVNLYKVDDSLIRIDIYEGKLNFPADVNMAVVEDWVSRGILLAYGHKPGTEGCGITIDTQSQPGRSIIGAVDDSGTMAEVYSKEKDDESGLWALMEKAVFNIELKRFKDANEAINRIINDFNSNPRFPVVLSYIADMYYLRDYKEAKRLDSIIKEEFPKSLQARTDNLWTKAEELVLGLDTNDVNFPQYVERFIEDNNSVPGVLCELNKICEYMESDASKVRPGFYERGRRLTNNRLTLCESVIERFPDSYDKIFAYKMAADVLGGTDIILAKDNNQGRRDPIRSVGYYQKILTTWTDYPETVEILNLIGNSYKTALIKGVLSEEEAVPLIIETYEKLAEDYPDTNYGKTAGEKLKDETKLQADIEGLKKIRRRLNEYFK